MRLALLLLVACSDPAAPVMPDAGADAPPPTCTGNTFQAPLGACCNEATTLCAGGDGVCVSSTCEPQCAGRWPLCPGGEPTYYDRADGQRVCYCE